MEENNQLEDFFRKRIENYKPESDQWEKDLDDVWENALPHISEPTNTRRKLWYWLFGALMIGLFTYLFLSQKKELTDLKETLSITENSVQELQKELKDIELQNEQKDLELENMKSKIEDLNAEKFNPVPEKTSAPSNKSTNSNQNISSENKINIEENQGFKSLQNSIKKEENLININEEAEERNADLLDTLAYAPIVALDIENSDSIDSLKLADEPAKKVSWVKLTMSPTFSNRKLKNFNAPNPPFATQFFSGIQIKAHFGWEINKRLSIESGVNYFQFSSKNSQIKSLTYSADNEQMTPLGLLRTSRPFALNTSIGLSSGLYSFTRKSTDFIAEGTDINLTFNSRIAIQYLQIPLLLNYKIKEGRFQMYARAGLVADIVAKDKFEVNEVLTDNPAFSFNQANPSQPQGLQDFTLNYLVGLGLEYRLNQNWSINLEPIYMRGMTPQAKPFNEVEVSLETISLGAGVKYRF